MILTERKKRILKAIIDDYIETSEPVGSKRLVEHYELGVSSATVRNEMVELEKAGLLIHPHTSSGRIPSDKGYREYVNQLIQFKQPSDSDRKEIQGELDRQFLEIKDVLKTATTLISHKTGYASVTLTPKFKSDEIAQIKMLMLEPGKALVVVVLSAGLVKDRLVSIPDALSPEQLHQVSLAIETGLAGMRLEDVTLITVETVARGIEMPDKFLNQVIYEAYCAIKQAETFDTYLEGMQKLLAHPEFHDSRKMKMVLETLMKDGIVAGFVDEQMRLMSQQNSVEQKVDQYPLMVRIGQEITLKNLEDCSFVTATYEMSDRLVGNIGVIGPKRMPYESVISQIHFVRHEVNKKFKTMEKDLKKM